MAGYEQEILHLSVRISTATGNQVSRARRNCIAPYLVVDRGFRRDAWPLSLLLA